MDFLFVLLKLGKMWNNKSKTFSQIIQDNVCGCDEDNLTQLWTIQYDTIQDKFVVTKNTKRHNPRQICSIFPRDMIVLCIRSTHPKQT